MIEVLNYKEKQQKHEFPSKLEKKMFKKFDYILILIVRTLKGRQGHEKRASYYDLCKLPIVVYS